MARTHSAAQLVGVLLASSAAVALLVSCAGVPSISRYQTHKPAPASLDQLADRKIGVQDLAGLRGGVMVNGFNLTLGVVMNTVEGNNQITSNLNLNDNGQLVAVASQVQVLPPTAPTITAPTAPTIVAPTAPTIIAPTAPTAPNVVAPTAPTGPTVIAPTPPNVTPPTPPNSQLANSQLAGPAASGSSQIVAALTFSPQGTTVTANPSGVVAPATIPVGGQGGSSGGGTGLSLTGTQLANAAQLASQTGGPAAAPGGGAAPSSLTGALPATPVQLASLTGGSPSPSPSSTTSGGTPVSAAATQIASAAQFASAAGGTSAPITTGAASGPVNALVVLAGGQTSSSSGPTTTLVAASSPQQGAATASSPSDAPHLTITGLGTSNFSAVLGNQNTTQVTQQLSGNNVATIIANRMNGINISQTTTLNVTVSNLTQLSNQMLARSFLNQISFTMSGIKTR